MSNIPFIFYRKIITFYIFDCQLNLNIFMQTNAEDVLILFSFIFKFPQFLLLIYFVWSNYFLLNYHLLQLPNLSSSAVSLFDEMSTGFNYFF